ncbi:helix-turn-helix domain-containing protein [Paenibacillus sp. HB172176]|uniref:response regulator transcription factor n=1 Tax=Paenibacillus sp. HB172176 TaxID=2493690 RepID=UPI001438F537|nr:helix-turn-helix domain-containing protein [Paenibacillus sp. HB172176]
MLNVLLVDDEPLARTHLRRLIDWEAHGFCICGEASSGQEAVDMLPGTQPRIIIADIDMAGMDGVALSRYVHDHGDGRIKLVMLSSFDNYEYVRETMRNGASDYLLKHRTDANALLELLLRLKEEVKQSETKPEGIAFMERHWPALNRDLAQNYLKGLVLGHDDVAAQAIEYFRSLSPVGNGRIVIAALRVSDVQEALGKRTQAELAQRAKAILNVMRQTAEQDEEGIVAELEQGRYVALFAFADERSQHAILQRVRSCLQKMMDTLRMFMNVHLSYGIGPVNANLNRIGEDYTALSVRAGTDAPSTEASSSGGKPAGLTLRQEKDLMAAVEDGSQAAVAILLDDIFSGKREAGKEGLPAVLPHTVGELAQLADKIWSKSGSGSGTTYYEGEWPTRGELSDPDKLDAIAAWVKSVYMMLLLKLKESRKEREYSPYVAQAVSFVRAKFSEGISLEMAAEAAGITDTYMGRLFKQETGVHFTEYLNGIRIEAAKQLIDSGDYRAKDIFERVGFSGYSYFFKVFKNHTGMTPQEYAKRRK